MESIKQTSSHQLKLAVVGHTNTGKTSLLRTLLKDSHFGEVADSPGTTRHVEGARLRLDGKILIELYDTPGLEDGIALYDYLDQLVQQSGTRLDGPDRIARFLDSPESRQRFEQEARVLKQLLQCHAGLYVVDVREAVLSKHKDELAILAHCGHPIVPILNFVNHSSTYLHDWKTIFARLGIHIQIEFDTVAPALDAEVQLYQKLALVLDQFSPQLNTMAEDVETQRKKRRKNATLLLAELLVDITAYRQQSQTDEQSVHAVWDEMKEQTKRREQAFIKELLKLYRFDKDEYFSEHLPLENGRWGMDLFHPQALKDMGIHVSKGFAAGAMAGAAVDVFTAGLSLGAATLIGGVVGSVWQGADKFGKRLMGHLQGYRELTVDEPVLRLLIVRSLNLIQALEHRGHAAQGPIIELKNKEDLFKTEKLPDILEEVRAQPEWSHLNKNFNSSHRRSEAIKRLSKHLQSP